MAQGFRYFRYFFVKPVRKQLPLFLNFTKTINKTFYFHPKRVFLQPVLFQT